MGARARLLVAVVAGSLVLASCGDDTDDDSSGGSTTTEASASATDEETTSTAEETTTTEEPSAGGGALVGTWTTDAGTYLSTLLGGAAGPTCTGPYELEFGDDGSFRATLEASCTVPGGSSNSTGEFVGTYIDDGSNYTLENMTGGGTATVTIGGQTVTQPIEDVGPPTGPVPYRVEGDQLIYEFMDTTFTFTRVS